MKLQLHRSAQKPDWELVAKTEQNSWQRLAAATHGIVTPGNIITIAGVTLVAYGLFLLPTQLLYGVSCIALGRLFDLLDGAVANITKTKSPVGELFDAAADKLVLFGAGIVIAVFGWVSWIIITLLFLQNIANIIAGFRARKHHASLHPSAIGKLATALQWIGLILLIAANALPSLQTSAYILIIAGIAAGVVATRSYIQTAYAK